MKVKLAFGVWGGPGTEIELPTIKKAVEMACKLALVFQADRPVAERTSTHPLNWFIANTKNMMHRESWKSATHWIMIEVTR